MADMVLEKGMTRMKKNFIFVGGCPRSGTTLLQNILDSHKNICGLPEFQHIEEIIYLRRKLKKAIKNKLIDAMCSEKEVDNRIKQLIDSFLTPFQRDVKTFVSEKTPRNILVFEEIIELYPEAKYIHVVRDPRAVVASLQEVGRKAAQKGRKVPYGTVGIRQPIQYLNQCLETGFQATEKYPDVVYTVVYEELVIETQRVTKDLCRYLEIEWDSAMITPAQKKHMGEKGITSEEHSIYYTPEKYNRDPDQSDINKWVNTLSYDDQVRVTDYFSNNKNLVKLGYTLNLKHLEKKVRQRAKIRAYLREKLGNLKLQLQGS